MNLVCKFMESPVGKLKLVASEKTLVAIRWGSDDADGAGLGEALEDERQTILVETERQLKEYFEGKRQSFSIPLDMRGTPFQRSVWQALLEIPFGETRSYGQIAKQVGRPKAMRAVGGANGSNPIPIVVPCHRVIGSSGKLTGFGGGLETKARLLKIESANGSGPHRKGVRIPRKARSLRFAFE
jgi:methylated-DNA-[protein]-cysteine S-methyltransferase